MKILIVSATPFEIAPLQNYLIENFQTEDQLKFQKDKLEVHLLITGVGLVLTGIHLTKKLLKEDYQLVINAGIAGTITAQAIIAEAAIPVFVAIGWTLLNYAAVSDFGVFFDFGFGQALSTRADFMCGAIVVTLAFTGGAGQ